MGIGPRQVPSVAEAATMHEVRLVPTPMVTEDSPELHEDMGGGPATPGSLSDVERHSSAVLPVADILHKERVVSTPMVTEESPVADEVIAGSIATLASPTQRVKPLPYAQGPAQLTQASLDTAISPPDASDPIQPAIIPRKKLERILLTTKADAGKFAEDCEAEAEVVATPSSNPPPWSLAEICETKEEKEEAVTSSRNRLKNQSPGHLISHFQDWLDDKSVEHEPPKFHSASINLPKSSPLAYLEGLNDGSPRPSIHNNDSQEADGYQIRAPPPGSHQDDVTGPSPFNLPMAVMEVKSAVIDFAEVLIRDMNKHPGELEYLKQTILREVKVDMDRANHWKYLVQAFIAKRFFDGFDSPNGYFDKGFKLDGMSTNVSFADFFLFNNKEATISMLLDSDSPGGSFLGRFCFKKFKSISGDLTINQPLPIYQEEWSAVERERHPKTVFYQSFLKVAVSVWLVHRLVHLSEEKVEMLIYEKGAKFQRQTMKSVVPGSYEEEDEEADVNTEVGFLVIPGFQVSGDVVKCEVYLRSRNSHTDTEITRETSTETSPEKKIFKTTEEKEEAVTSLGNLPKINSQEKNKRPDRLLSHFQDALEGKSAEFELPKLRKADRYIASSSSSRVDRNDGSREGDGFEFRAPPPGSFPENDTGLSPEYLQVAVLSLKFAVDRFAKILFTKNCRLEPLQYTILREVKADVDRAHHWKYLVQAFICRWFFDGFDSPNQCFGVEYFENDQMTKLISFADFSKLKDKVDNISMLLDSDSPDDSFLGRFCFKSFKSIIGELTSNQPYDTYQTEWDAIERECHPKTVFYQSFLKVVVSVYLLHRLVHSFEEKVEMLIYENGAKFQRRTMRSVFSGIYEEEDEEAEFNSEVGFSVIPGFQVSGDVVKCEVYLRNKNRHTDLEITGETSTEKTDVKSPVKSELKSFCGNTSVKLHSPELPVSNSHRPRSLQPPVGFSSSPHYLDHNPPTRVGDNGSSGLDPLFWEVQREDLNPGNQGSVSQSGRKNKYVHDNFLETFPRSHGHAPTVYKMAAPPAHSSYHTLPHYAARDTIMAEVRRLENTTPSPTV